MQGSDLSRGWTVRAVAGEVPPRVAGAAIPATVPRCVHTDLLRAGLLPDPYLDVNEALVQWAGLADWRYETTFAGSVAHPGERTDLGFRGLDTVARVELNGSPHRRDAQHAPDLSRRRRPAAGERRCQ